MMIKRTKLGRVALHNVFRYKIDVFETLAIETTQLFR